jgi:hypothetical protein
MFRNVAIVSLCESSKTDPKKWQREVVDRAARLDADNFPLEGDLAMCFGAHKDLCTIPPAALLETLKEVMQSNDPARSKQSVTNHAKQLAAAYTLLDPGTIIALKDGVRLEAWAEITRPYHYDAEEEWGIHRWGFRVLRRATDEERAAALTGPSLRPTMLLDRVALPADVARMRSVAAAERRVEEATRATAEAFAAEQDAEDAFAAALRALGAAQQLLAEKRAATAAARLALSQRRTERELAEIL